MTDEPGKRDARVRPRQEDSPAKKVKYAWLKRPVTWIISLLAAIVLAIGTAFGSSIGQHLASAISKHQASHSSPHRTAPPIIVESVATGFFQDYSFVTQQKTPLSQAQLQNINTQRISYNWAPAPPAAIANIEGITLTVAGNSPAPVTINNMMIVRHCTAPLTGGTLFYSPSRGAGPVLTPNISFNLDGPVSIGQYGSYLGNKLPAGGNFFAKKAIVLKYHQPETLIIFASTRRYYCTFTFNLNIATVHGQVSQPITYHGRPFSITADGEGGFGRLGRVPFHSFAVVYAGGGADQENGYRFIRVNPASYHGTGDPTLSPVHS
jgi:hypothetical protein